MASTHFFWTGVQVHGFDAFLFLTAASTHFFFQTPQVFDAFLHLKQVFVNLKETRRRGLNLKKCVENSKI